jgi:hypothetical protein
MRWFTAGAALVTGASVAAAIEMHAVADQAAQAHARAIAARAYVITAERHARETDSAIRTLTWQYTQVLTGARKNQRRMLASLDAARKAAKKAGNVNLAPVVYSTSFSAAPGVSAAAAGSPLSGTS